MKTDLGLSKHCDRRGCLGEGKWLPVLKANVVGQTVMEKPTTLGINIVLCDKCKAEFEPATALTHMGKAQWHAQVSMRRNRRINWDTLEVEWRELGAPQVVIPK